MNFRCPPIPALTGATILLALLLVPGSSTCGQEVAVDIEPWRLVRVFIQQTGSPSEKVDRGAFASRLSGEMATLDIEREIAGRWQAYVDVKIDTLIPLSPRIRTTPAVEPGSRPQRDTLERLAIFATTYIDGNYDNSYFYLEHDSLWRITHLRQFPTLPERIAITDRARAIDTSNPDFMLAVKNEFVLLESDATRRLRFESEMRSDANGVVAQLSRAPSWQEIILGPIATAEIDPFYPLDDTVSAQHAFLHRLNLDALDRLYRNGITRIYRSSSGILFEIGGLGARSMGYIYRDSAATAPELHPDNMFMESPIDRAWSLYKQEATERGPGIETGTGYDLRTDLAPASSNVPDVESGKEDLLKEK